MSSGQMIPAFQKVYEENRESLTSNRIKKYSNLKLNTNGYTSGTNSMTNACI